MEPKLKKISSGNRIIIPKGVCKKLAIKEGSYVLIKWRVEGDKLHMALTPAEVEFKPKSKTL